MSRVLRILLGLAAFLSLASLVAWLLLPEMLTIGRVHFYSSTGLLWIWKSSPPGFSVELHAPDVGRALVVAPILWLTERTLRVQWKKRRERSRLRSGRCPACGYDYRATPGKCPECGRGAADINRDRPSTRGVDGRGTSSSSVDS